MGRYAPAHEDDYEDDDSEDDFESPDAYDADDPDDEDAGDTVTCPHCRREISDMAEQCPRCGQYLSEEENPSPTFPRWVVVTALLLLAAIAMGWLGGVL
jgi:hypothetical protein